MYSHKDSKMKVSRQQAELALHGRMKSWSLASLLETNELDDASLGLQCALLWKNGFSQLVLFDIEWVHGTSDTYFQCRVLDSKLLQSI